ncbi:MAG: hypothetical protein OEZ34_13925 [Spirochaetia bacterium]|nr:hypothetical protein [Spirochaetia bacterium]
MKQTLKKHPQREFIIFKERLAANNIKISDTDYASELKITIKEFKAVKKEGHWNSVVIISAATEANTQEYEAKNKEYNYNLNSAVKALSLSLSVAIDEIKWDKLYPVD